jgi:hypothetical protein
MSFFFDRFIIELEISDIFYWHTTVMANMMEIEQKHKIQTFKSHKIRATLFSQTT